MKHTRNTQKKQHKIRKFILKCITYIMAFIFILSIVCIDSEPLYIPVITLLISGAWLYLMAWAHGWTY